MTRFVSKSILLLALARSPGASSFTTSSTRIPSFSMKPLSASAESQAPSALNHIEGIESLCETYDTFLLDMWGVMHNGSKPYQGVIETVQQLKAQNKKLIILSNSSKRVSNAEKMLTKLGFEPKDFEKIITSGEVSYRMLCGDETLECGQWSVLKDLIQDGKKKVFVFGSGDGDEDYVKSSGWTLAPIEEANLIVSRGTFTINNGAGDDSIVSKKDDEDNYFRVLEQSLKIAAERRVPMLVTNPDKVRPDEGLPPMPGAIGDSYEDLLKAVISDSKPELLVKRIGKPYSEVYDLALSSTSANGKAVMVGDALETDVSGGTWSECSTAWIVNDGIHSPAVKEFSTGAESDFEVGTGMVLDNFNDKKGYIGDDRLVPSYVSKHFRW